MDFGSKLRRSWEAVSRDQDEDRQALAPEPLRRGERRRSRRARRRDRLPEAQRRRPWCIPRTRPWTDASCPGPGNAASALTRRDGHAGSPQRERQSWPAAASTPPRASGAARANTAWRPHKLLMKRAQSRRSPTPLLPGHREWGNPASRRRDSSLPDARASGACPEAPLPFA